MSDRRTTRRAVLSGGVAAGLGLATAACSNPPTSPPPTTTAPAPPPSWGDLAGRLSNGLRLPGQDGFDPASLLYNPRFSPAPQAIAPVTTADDVASCVQHAADAGVPLRLRNGGHSYGGWSADAGLVVDLSALNSVEVDGDTATVGAGATLIDVYAALGAQGVAIGAGSCPTVGVSGLTLGGGVGVLAPSFGLTCDQVRSISVVTADGQQRDVDADSDPDLFWALRGGGPGLAAVTSWTFEVRPAPDVTVFFLRWPWAQAADVLAAWQAWVPHAPRELWSTMKLLANPTDGSRAQVSGAWTGSGSLDDALAGFLSQLPKPAANSRRTLDYASAMAYEAGCSGLDAIACRAKALDAEHRQPFAATSSMLQDDLPQAGIDAGVAAVQAVIDQPPVGLVEAGMSFDALGGAVADVNPDGTAFPWRSARATIQHTATWTGTQDPGSFDAVVTSTREALATWTGTAAYVNYADAGLPDRAEACWGDNLTRLRQIAADIDPDGVFASPAGVTG